MGDKLAVLEYHTSGPFTNSESAGRISYYGISGVPTAVFNGTDQVAGGGSGTFGAYYNEFNQQMAINTPGVLSLKVDYNPTLRTGTIIAKLNSVEQIEEGDLYLRYAITESHKYYEWYFLDSLQFIVRDMLPDYNGVSFDVGQGDTFVDSQSFYIDPGWVDYHCELVIFAQSDKGGLMVLISNLLPLYQTHVSGDANADGVTTISDVVFLYNYVLYGGPQPSPSAAGDVNEDCVIDAEDIVYLFNYLFQGGPEPLRGWEID
jgi:hypothetical protein